MYDRLINWSLEDFKNFNERYQRGEFRGSEARPYNLVAIEKWISIRDGYKLITTTDDIEDFNSWEELDITTSHSKYGTNYIYIDRKNKLWRIAQTADEFYGGHHKAFEI